MISLSWCYLVGDNLHLNLHLNFQHLPQAKGRPVELFYLYSYTTERISTSIGKIETVP